MSHNFKKAAQTLATIKGLQNFQPPDNSNRFYEENKLYTNKSLWLSLELFFQLLFTQCTLWHSMDRKLPGKVQVLVQMVKFLL